MEYVVVGAIVLALLWHLVRGRKYKRLFTFTHFLEVTSTVSAIKAAALFHADRSPGRSSPIPVVEPRRVVTSAGLVLCYTITPEGNSYNHHLSVSQDGRQTAYTVGDMFTWWVLHILGVDIRQCSLQISPSMVHFASWTFDREEHAEFSGRAVGEASEPELLEFNKEWLRSWRTVKWEHISRQDAQPRVGDRGSVMDEAQLVNRLQTTAPSCLKGFKATPSKLAEPFDNNPCSVWLVACSCGGMHGRLLGYPLKDYDSEYDGPECFLSPLAFECAACKVVTEMLDTDRHGYHAELARREGDEAGSAKLRGEGPRKMFKCPACSGELFGVTVGFVFWYPDELAEEFDGEWEELYNVFLCHCKCAGCGQTSQPTDFGKL